MPTLFRPYLDSGLVIVPEALWDGFYESAYNRFGCRKFTYTKVGANYEVSGMPKALGLKIARAEYNVFSGYDDHREDIPMPVVDLINDAGCYADGVHDDTAAVRAGFASAGYKGVVYAPPGRYLITGKIALETMFAKFYGEGLATEFYMTGNDSLFSLNESGATLWQFQKIQDIALYSNATLTDSACLKMNRVCDIVVDGLIVCGADKSIYMKRALRNRFIACSSNRGYLSIATSVPNTWVYADESEGVEANENKFVECNFCGIAAYGYYLKNGQFSIRGGCAEGVTETGIYISSANKFSIYDNHCEGSGGYGVHVVGSSCGDIAVIYSDKTVRIEGSSKVAIRNSKISGANTLGSRNCSVKQNLIGTAGLQCEEDTERDGNSYASGNTQDPDGFAILSPINLLSNDDLEDWATSVPDGFGQYQCTIAQETTIKRSGSKSCKITSTGYAQAGGLYFSIGTAKYARILTQAANTKSVTSSGYFYRPSVDGNIVTITLVARDGSGVRYFTPKYFDIPTDTWTKCVATFVLPVSPVTHVYVLWGMYGASIGKICYVDDVRVNEGKASFQDDLTN